MIAAQVIVQYEEALVGLQQRDQRGAARDERRFGSGFCRSLNRRHDRRRVWDARAQPDQSAKSQGTRCQEDALRR
jgi:hypothetical protein